MAGDQLGPWELKPILKRIRWGGTRLGTVLNKPIGEWTDVAESWEIVDHGDDQSVVTSGPHAGMTLRELVAESPNELFGTAGISQFPLLIKFLDATDRLSLQVHPNDEQAVRYDPRENGKTEAWVILDATEQSRIWLGLNAGVGREELSRAIKSNRIEDVVHVTTPRPGDCFFVPAGTVHAIGEGILLAEVQQSSDLTFRLHDWGRVGTDGKPREIHIEQSLDCTDYSRGPLGAVTPVVRDNNDVLVEELVRCPYFGIERHTSAKPSQVQTGGRFRIVMMLSGSAEYRSGQVEGALDRGKTILLPAACPEVELKPREESVWLEIDQP
ncbi:MAG: class I mannose-6-phosphate isomerase [Planctomycetes bacterium]|nr:class I mannose-6-phosphate isomerase [Planctomycetota bacterium]